MHGTNRNFKAWLHATAADKFMRSKRFKYSVRYILQHCFLNDNQVLWFVSYHYFISHSSSDCREELIVSVSMTNFIKTKQKKLMSWTSTSFMAKCAACACGALGISSSRKLFIHFVKLIGKRLNLPSLFSHSESRQLHFVLLDHFQTLVVRNDLKRT